MTKLIRISSLSLMLLASMAMIDPVFAESQEQSEQANFESDDDDLAFYDSNAGTFYAGIWQHLTTPRNLQKDTKSQLSEPANRLTHTNSDKN